MSARATRNREQAELARHAGKGNAGMKQLYPDLWQTTRQTQFSTLTVHAYLLRRAGGNVLFYNPRSTDDCPQMADLGGVAYHCLSHCHEVGSPLGSMAERFGSQLCCHARVEPYLPEATRADVCFRTPPREALAGDVEVIHTPGHTDNNVCYRYASPCGKTYLFTGDTLYLHAGEWRTLVVGRDGGNQRDLWHAVSRACAGCPWMSSCAAWPSAPCRSSR